MTYITGYSSIQNQIFASRGKVIYQNEDAKLDTFLELAFTALSISYPKFYKMDRLSKLGFLASEILVRDSHLMERYGSSQVALVMSNANASLDTDLRYFESTKTIASPALFVYTLTNIVMGEISIRHGIKGENAFFVFPKFDAEQLCDYVNMVMGSGKTEACMAGWVDVLGDQHDVFLYLTEKQESSDALEHTPEQLQKLYQRK